MSNCLIVIGGLKKKTSNPLLAYKNNPIISKFCEQFSSFTNFNKAEV